MTEERYCNRPCHTLCDGKGIAKFTCCLTCRKRKEKDCPGIFQCQGSPCKSNISKEEAMWLTMLG